MNEAFYAYYIAHCVFTFVQSLVRRDRKSDLHLVRRRGGAS